MSKKYVTLAIAGFVLFRIAAAAAYESRGYRAVGGEVLLLLLPVIWYGMENVVRDTIRWCREVLRHDELD